METLRKVKAFEAKYRNGIHYILTWVILVILVL